MENFFTAENCKRFVHAFVLFASLFEQHAHVAIESEFELVLAHINPRRSVVRSF